MRERLADPGPAVRDENRVAGGLHGNIPYKGSKARIDPARVRAMLLEGHSPTSVATILGINRASVHRLSG